MKFTDELRLTKKQRVPAGTPTLGISLSDNKYDVIKLIKKLSGEGIEIDFYRSEQEIKYSMDGVMRKSTLPLNSTSDERLIPVKYVLRGEGLGIVLEDYHRKEGSGDGRIGGDIRREDGVVCSLDIFVDKISYVGKNLKDGKEAVVVLEKMKRVLKEFYGFS